MLVRWQLNDTDVTVKNRLKNSAIILECMYTFMNSFCYINKNNCCIILTFGFFQHTLLLIIINVFD